MPFAKPRALFVDDDATVLAGISAALHRQRFSVVTAGGAAEALDFLAREPVAVVVSDECMPHMSGTAFLSEVRRRHPQITRMVLSGVADARAITQAVNEAGVFRYLLKPCTPADLTLAVEQGIEAHAVQVVTAAPKGIGLNVDAAIAGLQMAMQPVYAARDFALVGHEALLRFVRGVHASAEDLIEAAHRASRLWDVERAVRAVVADRLPGRPKDSVIFMNVHPQSLLDPELYDPAHPLSAHATAVILEITERSSLTDVSDLLPRIDQLRQLGYRIAVDDMGSGYSGFNAFAIRPDFVKFDRALIQAAKAARAEQKLVSSIATVCRELGIKTIAEGIEDRHDLDAARRMGCDFVQGYLLARPAEGFQQGPYRPDAGRQRGSAT